MRTRAIGVRWTVGNVSNAGFTALRLSICSAWNLFGKHARYAVCVNSVPIQTARLATGPVPGEVLWLQSDSLLPDWLNSYVDRSMAEGVAWKLAPVRVFKDRYEIALDNDVILWKKPEAMKQWLDSDDPKACLLAQDVQRCLGQFAPLCDPRAINSGIRGLPPGFDLEGRLQQILEGIPSLCARSWTNRDCRLPPSRKQISSW
ncbi:MAG TPA: hypothetical protein VN737_19620 [Bryobacteraceae bacterium]|nr:hypothetical protein [Bryobacteraceae bacterium]